jgi:hypothetical protein
MNKDVNNTPREVNPYLSVIYTDGELLQLKKKFISEREVLISKAEGKYTHLIPLYLNRINEVTSQIDKITSALGQNGASQQTYFDIG